MKRKTNEEYIEACRKNHNNFYSYEKTNYTGIKDDIIVTCPYHGDFSIKADSHLNKKSGCSKCGINKQTKSRTKNLESFINESSKLHNNFYSYDKSVYANTHTKLIITCPKHGDFMQEPASHLSGKGCVSCRNDKLRKLFSKDTNWFINESKKIHNEKYLYDKVKYKNNSTKVIITCKIHGDFNQAPSSHLSGAGCYFCNLLNSSINKTATLDDFIRKAKDVHGEKYNYEKSVYISSSSKIVISCNIHGDFEQTPNSHCSGSECPKCSGRGISKSEQKIKDILINNGIDFVFQKRFADCKNPKTGYMLVFDFYIPDINTLIEYDGAQHFMEIKNKPWESLEYVKYKDSIKDEYCIKNNIKLIRISYKEDIKTKLVQNNIISNI